MSRSAAAPVMALVTGIAEYQGRVLAAASEALEAQDIPLLIVANTPFGNERTPSLVLDLIRRRVPQGVIALADTFPFGRPEVPQALDDAGVPTVTLGAKINGVPRVGSDNALAMRELMRYLLDDRGARHVALVRGVPGQIDSLVREAVFREELAARGIEIDEDLVVDGWFQTGRAYAQIRTLLHRGHRPDAVVALNDTSAFGVLSALNDHGLRVPDDVLLTGFDNTEGSRLSWPALTTVDQNLAEQGRAAVDLLLRPRGEGRADDVLVPSQLLIRASTSNDAAAPLGDLAARARVLQTRVTWQDTALNLSWTTSTFQTMDDVIRELGPCLDRLGVSRCFIAVDRSPARSARPRPGADRPSGLVLSYRDGRAEPPPPDVFPRHRLLPDALRGELERGTLLLQPLSVGNRERGYLLFEPVPESYLLTEALRIDLPRTVDTVLSSAEMRDKAAMLERLVTQRTRELELANAELQSFVMRDGLTGIANRMAFQRCLEEHAVARNTDLAVLMVDVDMFKAFNDRYGHLAGDETLRQVAACLLGSVRDSSDLVCRYGGEEFAVVMRASAPQALSVAERFQELLARTAIRHEASTVAAVITASVGVAATGAATRIRPTDLVAAADKALYRAKLQGRNMIVVAPPAGRGPRSLGAGVRTRIQATESPAPDQLREAQ